MAKKKLTKTEVEAMQKVIDINAEALTPKTILVIKSKPVLKATKDGAELNDGYEFELNGALPEIADGIAKFAKELPNNDCGTGSDVYFIKLINEYFNKL